MFKKITKKKKRNLQKHKMRLYFSGTVSLTRAKELDPGENPVCQAKKFYFHPKCNRWSLKGFQ